MWNVIGWAVFGGLSGWIAALTSQRTSPKDMGRMIIVGILGGVVGGYGGARIVPETSSEMIFGSMMTAICAAVFAIVVSEKIVKSKIWCQQRTLEPQERKETDTMRNSQSSH